jgi:hypothetical protein
MASLRGGKTGHLQGHPENQEAIGDPATNAPTGQAGALSLPGPVAGSL